MAANRDERFKEAFADPGTQYYVAARLAAQPGLAPAYGDLLHHAVEMYLKAALVSTLQVEQMKRPPYSHDLTALWDAFKKKEHDPALTRFDATIQALHDFESIRYPDKIVDQGLMVSVAWVPHHAITVDGSAKMPPKYEVIVGDVDNLVIEVLDRARINPKALVMRVFGTGRQALGYPNPRAGHWL
jgi:hypothetical protein